MSSSYSIPPRDLIIRRIEKDISEKYIVDVFYKQHIAKVSSVLLIEDGSQYNMAIVEIGEWHSGVVASNFVMRLQTKDYFARMVHRSDYYWTVTINPKKAVTFSPLYFEDKKGNNTRAPPCSDDDESNNDELLGKFRKLQHEYTNAFTERKFTTNQITTNNFVDLEEKVISMEQKMKERGLLDPKATYHINQVSS